MPDPGADPVNGPRCPNCGYLLVGLPELRCPECGKAIDPAYLEMGGLRERLLPWERPELGGPGRRLVRTLAAAFVRPGRYWSHIAERKNYSIAGARRFILSCVGTAFVVHFVAFIADIGCEFLRLYSKGADARRAWDMTMQTISITWWILAYNLLVQLALVTFWVTLVAFLVRGLFRFRLDSFSTVGLATAFSPLIAIAAPIWAVALLVAGWSSALSIAMSIGIVVQLAILFLHLWFCCRRLLLLGVFKSLGMQTLGVAVLFVVGVTVDVVLDLLNLVV